MRWFIISIGSALLCSFTLARPAHAARDEDADGYDVTSDCDDNDATVHPGATEVCDGIDDDCDGEIDEGVTVTYYIDEDGDGWGSERDVIEACEPSPGYVSISGDCDDDNPYIFPGAGELCDGIDNDCDGVEDDGIETSTWYADRDGDGAGDPYTSTEDCEQPDGTVANGDDCDDRDPAVQTDCDTAVPDDTAEDTAEDTADDSSVPVGDSGGGTDTGAEDKDDGCGGCGGGSAAVILALALAGGLGRRRR